MPSLQILDVAIGLAVIYATLALACTAANEIVAQAIGLRGRTLVKGIRQLVSNDKIAKDLLGHPLIATLGRTGQPDKGDAQQPSYVPGNTFALALIDTITNQGGKLDPGAFRAAVEKLDAADLKRILTLLDAKAAAKATQAPNQTPAPAGELDRLSAEIASWYDEATDRISGWYKRRLQFITLIISALLCGFINADTVAITQALANDATLRAGLVAYAEGYAKTNPAPQPKSPPANDTATATGKSGEKPAGEQPGSDPAEKIAKDIQTIYQTVDKLDNLGIPLGWKTYPSCGKELVLKFFGLLITILAVSLGAPFWFDLLGKFINIRSAGAAPKKAAEGAKA